MQNNRNVVVGPVALGMCDQVPLLPPVEALSVMGSRLNEALMGEQRERVATAS